MHVDEISIDFLPLEVSEESCTVVSYELEYIDGPLKDMNYAAGADLSLLVFNGDTIETTTPLISRNWLGLHKLKVRGYNGSKDPDSSFGDEGVYSSV